MDNEALKMRAHAKRYSEEERHEEAASAWALYTGYALARLGQVKTEAELKLWELESENASRSAAREFLALSHDIFTGLKRWPRAVA